MAEGAECGQVSLTPAAAPELAAAAFNICPALQQALPDAAGRRRAPLPALKAGLCLELGECACLHTVSSQPGSGRRTEGGTFSIDWLDKSLKYRLEHPGEEALVRACLNRLPEGCRVWDATAGLGRDSLILASRGAQVTMFERHAVVYLLLLNASLRAHKAQAYSFTLPKLIFGTALDCAQELKARLLEEVSGSELVQTAAADTKVQPSAQYQLLDASAVPALTLQEGAPAALSPAAASGLIGAEDAAQAAPLAAAQRSAAGVSTEPYLSEPQAHAAQPSQLPQVIYYDPMFPERRKSAKVKKEMQVFQLIVGSDADTLEMAEGLCRCCTKRLVIKRPAGAPPVQSASLKPAYSVDGGGCRFDCYLPR